MRDVALVVGLAVSAAGCSGPDVVARVGSQELTVERLSQVIASAPDIAAAPESVESMAMRWVEYSLVGMRAADGDALIDSATIVAATWAEMQAAVTRDFRSLRAGESAQPTSQQVDSAYRAGDVRLLRQILKRTTADMTSTQRDAIRAETVRIHERLVAGGSWAEANALNEDETGRPRNGSIGLVQRGQTVPPFESVAFALAPGELSGVVETADFGFHLIHRPELEEVRDEFTTGLNALWTQRLDSMYQAELLVRRPITMAAGVPAAVREVIAAGLYSESGESQAVLATYEGGPFTVSDLVRYLRYLPQQFLIQAPGAPDDQLTSLVRSFVIREATELEAREAGASVSASDYDQVRTGYVSYLERLRAASGMDPAAFADIADVDGSREQAVAEQADEFLQLAARDVRFRLTLPPGLASYLLAEGDWEVFQAGIDEVVARVELLRSLQPSS